MKERIQKLIAARGIASRRAAEQIILDGRVSCNGTICTLGQSADPDTDIILIDGVPLPPMQSFVYIMLNKPKVGMHENKITMRFLLIGVLLAVLTFVTLKIR